MKTLIFAVSIVVLTGCSASHEDNEQETPIGSPDPASVYCFQKGGRSEIVRDTDGNESGYCNLPSGERIEEWALYHRDHK